MDKSFSHSRRNFLGAAALAAVATADCTAQPGPKELGPVAEYIDAHVHVWTENTQQYPLAPGFTNKDMVPAHFMPNELFEHCRPQGVKRIVLIQMSFYRFDNRYLIDSVIGNAQAFSGVGIVDETKPDVKEDMERLAAHGVRGFRIRADREKAEGWSDSAGMKAMWSFAADAGLSMCLLADPDALPAVLRMCEAYPKTRVVIDHFARIGMKGAIDPHDLDNLCRLAESKHVYVKTSAFYALGAKKAPYTDLAPMIRKLRDTYGASRLMWASDCPFQVQDGHTYADSIALIRDRLDFLSAEDKEWMLRKTAEKVFFAA